MFFRRALDRAMTMMGRAPTAGTGPHTPDSTQLTLEFEQDCADFYQLHRMRPVVEELKAVVDRAALLPDKPSLQAVQQLQAELNAVKLKYFSPQDGRGA